MKNCKWMALLVSVCMLATMLFAPAMAEVADGTYTATAKGMFDGLPVEVTMKDGAIENIVVTEYQETAPGWPAIEKLPAALVEAQSIAVDSITGATRTSEGI